MMVQLEGIPRMRIDCSGNLNYGRSSVHPILEGCGMDFRKLALSTYDGLKNHDGVSFEGRAAKRLVDYQAHSYSNLLKLMSQD
jgi:hypothetical protein